MKKSSNKKPLKKSTKWIIGIVAFFIICAAIGGGSDETGVEKNADSKGQDSSYSIEANEKSGDEYVNSTKGSVGDGGKTSQKASSKEKSTGTKTTAKSAAPKAQVGNYSGKDYVTVNGNVPLFTDAEKKAASFEKYSSLDSLKRCGVAYACIGRDLMPTGERGAIGSVKPSGWRTVKYDCVDGKYLYNRCHLIGWQLTAENANEKNLITGTRYFNVKVMLPFENMVADYIKETGNHVLYRVTPDFKGNELVARGVYMEAFSVEDGGKGICFYVYCYNIQPGVSINYADGSSSLSGAAATTVTPVKTTTTTKKTSTTAPAAPKPPAANSNVTYIGNSNKNSMKFHYPSCPSVARMNEENKVFFYGSRDEVIEKRYTPCGNCNP